ncbi:MAG: hypothetical protein QXP36_04415 [Conexivisphaerales archaeon]
MRENKRELLESALQILKVEYSKSSSNDDLIKLLNSVITFPSSQNEWEIKKTIKSIIDMREDSDKRDDIIKHLKDLVSYSDWD